MKPDIGSIPTATPGHGCAPPLGATALCQPGGKAHGRLAKTVLCEKLKKNAADQNQDNRFVRAEPAQSKRTWKFHRAILCKDLQEKYRAPTLGQPMTTVLRNRNAHGHLARTVLYENLQKKCRAPRPGQPFCASRACAVETHMDMPQEPSYARIYRKNTAPQRRDNRFAQSKCTWTSRKCCFMGEFRGKMPCPKTGTTVFRKPAQSKRTWTCHKSHIVPEFLQEKCHAPRSRRRLCASLHSRNAHGHVDKNNFCEIYRKNARNQMEHPLIKHRP